jgi:hypothetical protein
MKATIGLLPESALKKVEKKEQSYAAAIGELEALAKSKLTNMDLSLAELYRQRLATIDWQIAKCKEAIALNPANAISVVAFSWHWPIKNKPLPKEFVRNYNKFKVYGYADNKNYIS